MGKAVIIIIAGLTIIIGIIATSIIGRSSDAQNSSVSTFKKTYAKNISTSAAEYYFRQLKTNTALRGSFSISSILNGSANVVLQDWTAGVTDSIRLTSIGTYTNAKETVTVKIVQGSSFPIINSAANFQTPSLTCSYDDDGSLSIDGYNHDMYDNLLAPSSNDKSGASVTNSSCSAALIPAYADKISGTSDVIIDPTIPNPSSFVNALISKADYTYSGSSVGGQTWGSPSSPKIVYINGNVDLQNSCTGWGILICTANTFRIQANFTFYGLVIVYSPSSAVTWNNRSYSKIVGGLLIASPSLISFNTQSGSGAVQKVHYSKAALDLAKSLAGGLQVANWSE